MDEPADDIRGLVGLPADCQIYRQPGSLRLFTDQVGNEENEGPHSSGCARVLETAMFNASLADGKHLTYRLQIEREVTWMRSFIYLKSVYMQNDLLL